MKHFILPILLLVISCDNNSSDDLTVPIETEAKTTYTNSIKNIIDNNCVICHGNTNPSGNLSLTTYTQVKNAVQNNGLLTVINSNNPSIVMPTSGKMPQTNLDKIADWNNDGLIE